MSSRQILFRISYVLALAGGFVAVAGAWLLAQPSVGANIGAGLLIMGATALMVLAVATGIAGLIGGSIAKYGQSRKTER